MLPHTWLHHRHNKNSQLLVVYRHCLEHPRIADDSAVHRPCTTYHDFPQQLPCLWNKHRHLCMATSLSTLNADQNTGTDVLGTAILPTSMSYCPYFVKWGQPTKHQFYRRNKRVGPFYIWQRLWEVGWFSPTYLGYSSRHMLSSLYISWMTISWMICYT
jgi:hypothetical protein